MKAHHHRTHPLLLALSLVFPVSSIAQESELLFTLSSFGGGLFFTNRAQDVDLRDNDSVAIAPGSPQPIGLWTYQGSDLSLIANASTPWPVPGENGSIARFSISMANDGDAIYFAGKREFADSDALFVSEGGEVSLIANMAEFGKGSGRVDVRQIEAAGGRVLVNIHQGAEDVSYSAYLIWDAGIWSVLQEAEDGSLNRGATLSSNGEWILMENALVSRPGGSSRTAFEGVSNVGGFSLFADTHRPLTISNDGTVHGIGFLADGTGKLIMAEAADGTTRVIVEPTGEVAGLPLTANGILLLDDSFMASDGEAVFFRINGEGYQNQHYLKIAPDASIEAVATFPLALADDTWSFPSVEDVARGAILFSADNADRRQKGFIRVGGDAGDTGPPRSLWADFAVTDIWKASGSLGWIYDDAYPLIYSFDLGSYVHVFAEGASLDGYFFYLYRDRLWFYTIDSFGGWAYQLTGDSIGWLRLIGE